MEDKDLSAYTRSRNVVSIMIDQKVLYQLDRLDWKNDSEAGFVIEVEKDSKIGTAKGSDIKETVKQAVAAMKGEKIEKAPTPVTATATPSFWKKIFG